MASQRTEATAAQDDCAAKNMHGLLSTESAGWADRNSRVTPTCLPRPVDGPKPDKRQGGKHYPKEGHAPEYQIRAIGEACSTFHARRDAERA